MSQYLLFQVGDTRFAIDIVHVESVEPMQMVTLVPGTASHVKGVINLRGEIVPVMDMNRLFGQSDTCITEETRIVVVSVDEIVAGLVVHSADEVVELDDQSSQPPAEVFTAVHPTYVRAISSLDGRSVIILDPKPILDPRTAVA
ncbi:MAG: chemotaxis protein CheW [Alicyclobacillus sp.]|nr:chemotaxis protein CheW [Alicyclobacillus sp.]